MASHPSYDKDKRRQYQRAYQAAYRAAGRDKAVSVKVDKPFVGVDGEGGNTESGYHAYFLLTAGQRSIVPATGNARLTTRECLEFLCDLPRDAVYVVYFGDYDVTKILEDLPFGKLEKLIKRELRTRADGKGVWPVDCFDDEFQVDYLPRKEFKVRRMEGKFFDPDTGKEVTKYGPWLVINDVGSFFQTRFVDALSKWNVGTDEEREAIGRGKEARGSFDYSEIEDIATYNALEIELLQQLMEKFRAACKAVGYVPARWQGPGLLAEAMLSRHSVPRTKDVPVLNDPQYDDLITYARNAFYGGRPEIMAIGPVARPVRQFDINSAYPYAMQFVPCLIHGEWTYDEPNQLLLSGTQDVERVRLSTELPDTELQLYAGPDSHNEEGGAGPGTAGGLGTRDEALALCYGSFTAKQSNDNRYPLWYGLPTRSEQGTIVYPGAGRGWYWSFEIRSAKHQNFHVEGRWRYTRHCECRPLEFVSDVYQQRMDIGKNDAGTVLKLGLNSLYGKQVQSVGSPKYANPIWGSFITAYCRTMIQDFIHSSKYCKDPTLWCGKDILMIATDSLCTFNERPDIESSEVLGGWSREEHPRGMFLVQPGLYFGSSGKSPKTRGVPRSVIESREQDFRDAFDRMVRSRKLHDGDLQVEQRMFVGIRNALHRRNLKLLGQWVEFRDPDTGVTGKTVRFDWSTKRRKWPVLDPIPGIHSYIETFPQEGDPTVESLPYSKDIGGLLLRQSLRTLMDDQPDWSPYIEPGELSE